MFEHTEALGTSNSPGMVEAGHSPDCPLCSQVDIPAGEKAKVQKAVALLQATQARSRTGSWERHLAGGIRNNSRLPQIKPDRTHSKCHRGNVPHLLRNREDMRRGHQWTPTDDLKEGSLQNRTGKGGPEKMWSLVKGGKREECFSGSELHTQKVQWWQTAETPLEIKIKSVWCGES